MAQCPESLVHTHPAPGAQAVGLRPANLTGVPEFDDRFRVETSTPGGGDLVTAQVIEATSALTGLPGNCAATT